MLKGQVKVYNPHTSALPPLVPYKGVNGSIASYVLNIVDYEDLLGSPLQYAIWLPKNYLEKDEVEAWIAENITRALLHHRAIFASFDDLMLFKLRWQGRITMIVERDAGAFTVPMCLSS